MISWMGWGLIAAYVVIVLLIGYFSSRRESVEGFMIADRKLGWFALACTVAATMLGGNALVTYSAFMFQFGPVFLTIIVGAVISIAILIWMATKLKRLSEKERFYTLPDYFYNRFGKGTGITVTIITIIWFIIILIIQFIAGGRLINTLTDFPYHYAVLIMGIVVAAYLLMGGFRAVVKTDIFQYLLLTLLVVITAFFVLKGRFAGIAALDYEPFGWGKALAFIIIGANLVFVGADMWQRVYAAKDVKTVGIGFSVATVAIVIAFLAISAVGLAAKAAFPGIAPSDAVFYGFTKLLPPYMIAFGFILLFAVIMSTIDTILFVLASSFTEDVWRKNINAKIEKVKYTRIGAVIFIVLALILALFVQDIVSFGLAFASLGLVFSPSMISSFIWKMKPKAVILSLITGTLAVFIVFGMGYIGAETSVISLPVALVFLVIGQFVFKKEKISLR